MKTIDYEILTSQWLGLAMRYGNSPISSSEFSELCKCAHISLGNGMKNAYEKANIISCPSRGQVVISGSISRAQIVEACETVKKSRKAYREQLEEVHAFNLRIEARNNPDFTPEACVKYLESLGYFVYKPSKGEKITITTLKEFCF